MRSSDNIFRQFLNDGTRPDSGVIRRILVVTVLLFFSHTFSFAQLTEIGFQLGAFNYTGDLSRSYNITNHRPGASLFLRTNISDAVGLKYGLAAGMIHGKHDFLNSSGNEIQSISFNTTILEAFGVFEFYFLDYKSRHSEIHWTPYLSVGLGIFTYFGDAAGNTEQSIVQPAIPLGIGIKYQVSKKVDIGFEASARATFFNYLDGIDGNDPVGPIHVYGKKYNFDTYYFIGITLNYTLYFIPCPYGYD